ncbi:MAG: transcriptional coactivator p15/PC4 family protein [Deltaproteobacteria bacterium]|nr:transcriptional coactivator p15/PC4 family protein [Deltaproteobacteria bacterium]
MSEQEEENAVKIPRNQTEQVRVGVKEFKGKSYIDIRIYYMDDQGDWKPTKKGVSLSTEYIAELKDAVNIIEGQIQALEEAE